MHYDRKIIVLAFRVARPAVLNPTEERLVKFDEDLHTFFQDALEKEAAKNNIDPTKANFSQLVFFADQTDDLDPKKCAVAACKYFLAVNK